MVFVSVYVSGELDHTSQSKSSRRDTYCHLKEAITIAHIHDATGHFAEDHVISHTRSGILFKATLPVTSLHRRLSFRAFFFYNNVVGRIFSFKPLKMGATCGSLEVTGRNLLELLCSRE